MSEIRPLTDGLSQKAQYELNEDPITIDQNIQLIREWIHRQPHIRARTDSQFLVAFLRTNKYSIESAKKKLEGYYAMRSTVPELFRNRDVDDLKMQEIFKLGVGLTFPNPCGEAGPRISMVRPGIYDPSRHNIKDIIKAGTFIGDIQILEDDNLIISGVVEIMDLANVTLGHLLQMDAMLFRTLSAVAEAGTPLRHKGLHFINTPPGFNAIFSTFKNFLGEKNKTRLFSHGNNMESLFEHIPRHLLPAEYGGENSSIADTIDYWYAKILSYRDYFNEDEQYGVVEEFRPQIEKPSSDSIFGAKGTFRKLNFD